jgi:uncharacterized protein YjbJ (UPF0337 family)
VKTFFLAFLLSLSLTAQADMVLREDTASQTRQIGPFVDNTGAVLSGLTISNTDVKLSKQGAAAVNKNSGGCTHDVNGMYLCTFDATDSSTAGSLQVTVVESGALPVYHEFQVATQSVYDACCDSASATQTFPTNFASLAITGGGAVTAGTVSDKTGYSLSGTQTFNNTGTWTGNLSGSVGSVTGAVGSVTGAVGSVTGNVGGTINGLTSTAQGNVRTALGMATNNLDTQLGTINTAVVTTIPAAVAVIDGIVDQLLVGVNVTQQVGIDICGSGTEADPWGACP